MRFSRRPRFRAAVLAGEGGSATALRATQESLRALQYGEFDCAVVDLASIPDPSAWLAKFNASLAANAQRDWLMLLRAAAI